MATLEELDFTLKINDEEFDKQVGRIKEKAKEMNEQISTLLSSFNKNTTAQTKISLAQEKLNTQIQRTHLLEEKVNESKAKQEVLSQRAYQLAIKNNQMLSEHNKHLSNSSRIWREIKNYAMIYFSARTVGNFVGGLINVSAEFEKQKIALGAIIQDTLKADAIFSRLKTLAVESPFNFTELVNYTKQLSAYNIPVNELYNTTKMLADVSAGLGVDMSRLVLAYGQVSSAEFLRGQEVRQFTEAGLPILQKLADQFSILYNRAVSVKEVFDLISKRQVPFEMVKQVFIDLTSEGGKFFNMQAILADTLSGKISNLKDAYQLMLYEMGEKTNGIVGGAVDTLRKLIENYDDVGRALGVIIATFGVYKSIQMVEVFYREAQALRALKTAINAAQAAQVGLNVASKASIWGLVVSGIVAVGGTIWAMVDSMNELSDVERTTTDITSKFNIELASEKTKLDQLMDSMKKLNPSTDEYKELRRKLLANYGQYLDDIDKEKIRIGDLASVYNKLTSSIENSTKAKINQYAIERIQSEKEGNLKSILKEATNFAKNAKLTESELVEVITTITSTFDSENIKPTFGVSVIDKITKEYGKRGMRVLREFESSYRKAAEDWDNAIEKVNEKYKFTKTDIETEIAGVTEEKDIRGIKEQIAQIEKLIDSYKKIESYRKRLNELGVENPDKAIADLFPMFSDMVYDNAEERINELLDLLNSFGEEGKQAANKIKFDLANDSYIEYTQNLKKEQDALKKLEEEFGKAREKYEELKASLGEGFELKGVGAIYDISKDVKAYYDAFDKIMQKKQEAIDALNKTDKVESDKFFELNALETLSGQELDNALATLKDKLNTDGGKIFKEFLDTLGLPDGEWSKINPFKRFKISKMLKNVFDNEGLQKQRQVIEEMLKASGKFSQTQIDELLKPLDKGIGDEADNALNKLKNLGRQDIEYIARNIKELASSLTQYAEASGDSRLQEGIDVVGLLAQVGQDFAKKDWAGVVTQSAKALINTIISEISYAKQLEAQIKKTRHEVDLLDWTNMLDTDTIFGDDLIKKMSQASKVLEQINGKYQSLTDNLRNQSIGGDVVQGIESFIFSLGNIPFAIQNSMGKINAFDEAIKKGYKDLETYIVKFNDRSGLANLFGFADQYNNLRDLFASVGFDSTELGAFRSMYDKYGNLNTEGLQKILDTYDRLSNEDRAWMEEAIDYADAYKEAMDEVYSTLENVYGGAVSDLTDLMIDNWIKAGDAAGNYSNILSDVAKNYAKLMIQNTLLDKIFNEELQGKFADAFLKGDSTSAMRLFVDAIDSIEEYIPTINEILQGINNEIPLLEESSDTLSSGIKSITEETASLLASYVNAIRADVSYNKLTLKDINNDVKAILGLLPTTPTLTMYLTQIQANTYNTQLATERVVSETHNILTEIQSVIGTESGATAIRVSM